MKYYDIYFAIVITVCASIVAIASYARILELTQPARLWINAMPLGTAKYAVLSHGKCVGTLATDVKDDVVLATKITANIKARVDQNANDVSLECKAFYNPLGQLSESNCDLNASPASIKITTRDINPVQITIEAATAGNPISYSLKMPGPVTLKKNTNQAYDFEFLPVLSQKQSALSAFTPIIQNELALEVVPYSTPMINCDTQARATLDLSSIMPRILLSAGSFVAATNKEGTL